MTEIPFYSWRLLSSVIWHRTICYKFSYISEKYATSIFRIEEKSERTKNFCVYRRGNLYGGHTSPYIHNLKGEETCTRLHGVTSQKTVIFPVTTVGIKNLHLYLFVRNLMAVYQLFCYESSNDADRRRCTVNWMGQKTEEMWHYFVYYLKRLSKTWENRSV
jgi:hypothetical protein